MQNNIDQHKIEIDSLPDTSSIPSNMKTDKVLELYNISADAVDDTVFKLLRKRINEISSGERKYLETFMILHKKCLFALLDEPFMFLSPLMRDNIKNLIQIKSREKGIVIADHNYRSVLDISNRILLVKDESIYELKDEKDLRDRGYI